MSEPRTWDLWAGLSGEAHTAGDDPDRPYADIDAWREYAVMHGHEQVVPITATEDPEGTYYGWIFADETVPVMIYGHQGIFACCFPYGVDAEVELGRGEVVRLTLTARGEPEPARAPRGASQPGPHT